MLRGFVIACAVFLATACAAQAQTNWASNGTFNSPSQSGTSTWTSGSGLTGWTLDTYLPTGYGVKYGAGVGSTFPSGPGLTGSQGVQLGNGSYPTFKEGGINQTISATIPGQFYSITVYAEHERSSQPGTIATVSFGGQVSTLSVGSAAAYTWTPYTWTESASSTSALLDITGNTSNTDAVIVADLSVTLAQVPTVWSGGTSTDWGTVGNWYNASYVPSYQGIAVTFGTAGANATPTLVSSSQTAGIVNFVSSVKTTLSASAGNYYLYLDDTGGSSASAAINVSGSHTISANVQLNSPAAFNVTAGTDQLTVSGTIANGSNGAQGLSLSGAGTLTLTAANTFSGTTSVASGTLLLANNSALQNSTLAAGGVSFANAATAGTLGGLSGNGSFSLATITGQQVALAVGNNGQTTTFGGALGGAGSLTKVGSGELTMSGANTFSGNTYVSNGTLAVGTPLAFQDSPLNPAGPGTFSFGTQTSATLGGLTNTGALNLANVSSHSVSLSLNTTGTLTFSGSVTGPGSLTMIGSGTQVLSGINSYSGGSNVTAGTLQFQGGPALPSLSPIGLGGGVVSIDNDGNGSSGTISLGNNITVTAAATVDIDVRNNGSGNTSNVVSFGTLSNGTPTTAHTSTIDFTAANGYRQSFLGLNLPGSTGDSTTLNPTGTTVSILGNVANPMSPTGTGQYDTLFLDGTSTGNIIYGTISDSTDFGGVNKGDTRITKSNSSLWVLAGAGNSYSGPTLISGGTLQLGTGQNGGQDGTLGNSGIATGSSVTNNAVLVFDYFGPPSANTASNSIAGSGALSVIGPGGVTLAASNTYTGPTNIASGTLALGSNGSIAQSSTISLSAGATFDVSQVGSFQLAARQTLSGTGNYAVNGGMTLAASSTLLPGGVASTGTLNVGGLTLGGGNVNFDLSTSATLDLINVGTSNGGLTLNGGSIGLYQSNGKTTFSTSGTYLLMNYGNGNSINGSLGNLSVLDPASTNVYSFTATNGSLEVTILAPNVWNGGANPLFVWSSAGNWTGGPAPANGAALMFAGATGLSNTNNISNLNLSGISFASGAGAFNLTGNSIQLSGPIVNNSAAAQTIGLNITLTASSTSAVVGAGNVTSAAGGSIVLGGVIDDAGAGLGINVGGPGTVVLGGANTYSGTTNVAGPLRLANPLALQNSPLEMLSGGSLTFAANTTTASIPALSGATGSITLTTSTGQPVVLTVTGGYSGNTTFGGTIKGGGSLVKQGNGTLTLIAQETYGGATSITGGVLQLGANPANPATPAGTVAQYHFDGSLLDSVGGHNGTLNGTGTSYVAGQFGQALQLAGSPYVTVPYSSALGLNSYTVSTWVNVTTQPTVGTSGPALISTRNGSDDTFDLQFVQSSSGIDKLHADIGNGSAFLTSAANYTAPGLLSGWNMITYTVNSSGYSIFVNGSEVVTNASYSTPGTPLFMKSGQTLSFGAQEANTASYGNGGFLQGALDETVIVNGALSAAQVEGLYLGAVAQLPNATPVTISNGGTFDMTNGQQTILSLSSTDGNGSQVLLGYGGLTIANTAGTSTTFDGVISDGGLGGSVTVQGGGLTLTGRNTYTGGTTIIGGGTLQLAAGANGDGSISSSTVNDSGTLLYYFSDTQTVGYNITGQGSLRLTGGGMLTLTATNSYYGATTINSGTLQLGTGPSGQDGALYAAGLFTGSIVADNGALVYDLAGSQTATYNISGSGSLTLASGTLALSGNNSYAGGTYVEDGTLIVTNPAAIEGGSSLTVGNAADFAPLTPATAGVSGAVGSQAAAVPEPGAAALAGAGAVLLAICRVRRRRRWGRGRK